MTIATVPDDFKRDWVAANGRARIEVFPKGDANDSETLRRFVTAVQTLAPDATGAPVSMQGSGRTIVRAFLQAALSALLSIVLLLAFALRRTTDVLMTLAPLALSALATTSAAPSGYRSTSKTSSTAALVWHRSRVQYPFFVMHGEREDPSCCNQASPAR